MEIMEEHQNRGNSSLILRSYTDPNQPPGFNLMFRLQIQSGLSDNHVCLHFRVPVANFTCEELGLEYPIGSSYLSRVDPVDKSEVESYHEVICSFARDVVQQSFLHPFAGAVGINVRILIGTYRNVRVTEWKGGEEDKLIDQTCPICMDDLVHGVEVSITDCGHVFHARCLREWIERNPSCPLCRSEL